ncbi:MAG: hypothetical protein ACJ790_22800, partial [Myxococcaceae bacterium]
ELVDRAQGVAADPLRMAMAEVDELGASARAAYFKSNRVALYDAWVRTQSVESMVQLVLRMGTSPEIRESVLSAAGMDPELSDEEILAEAFAVALSSATGEQEAIAEAIRSAVPNPLG